jgi:hypothetical protein
MIAFEVWDDVFNDEDRKMLGGDLEACWRRLGTAGMWMEARRVCLERALIDMAVGCDLMTLAQARKLETALDLPDRKLPHVLPQWDPQNGSLSFDGRLIRNVRILRDKSNIQKVLDAFEAAGWPTRIDNPLVLGQQQLHETIRSLNHGLETIRFHTQEGAEAVVWCRV